MARIYLSPPDMGPDERRLLLEAFDSNWIAPVGRHLDAFEREVSQAVGARAAAALSSGTAALHLSLLLLGVGSGDEVLVSDLTFVATANAVRYVGATPVFVDADPETWTLCPELLAEALGEASERGRLPRAVIAVDLYGQPADYDEIARVCARYEVPVIQDASEALGARYRERPCGSQGAMGVLSFNGNKILTTSGGGMLVSDREDFIAEARFLSTQARDPAPHYEHSRIGYNYRLSNLLAAVGRGQLGSLEAKVEARRRNFDRYQRALGGHPGVGFMPEADYARHSRWLTCLTLDPERARTDPETLRQRLEAEDIEARPLWKPMHLQPLFRGCKIHGGAVGERLFQQGLCLPSGSGLTEDEQRRVLSVLDRSLGPST